MTSIIGSSGAGKTTLMNILAQRNLGGLQLKGVLRANGIPNDFNIGNISSYVQQNDIFVGALTVKGQDLNNDILKCLKRGQCNFVLSCCHFPCSLIISCKEYLTFVVRLRLSKSSESKQNNQIDYLIKMMGLTDCQNEACFLSSQT